MVEANWARHRLFAEALIRRRETADAFTPSGRRPDFFSAFMPSAGFARTTGRLPLPRRGHPVDSRWRSAVVRRFRRPPNLDAGVTTQARQDGRVGTRSDPAQRRRAAERH